MTDYTQHEIDHSKTDHRTHAIFHKDGSWTPGLNVLEGIFWKSDYVLFSELPIGFEFPMDDRLYIKTSKSTMSLKFGNHIRTAKYNLLVDMNAPADY